MSGFGSQPFGSSPYGIGTPATAPSQEGSILRDAATGDTRGSRLIDALSGDYVLDENGRLLGMDDVKQLVYLAVRTDKGSSAMRTLGQELRKIDRITPNFVRRVDSTLRDAVKHLVRAGLIEVENVRVDAIRPGVAFARMRWRNLATDESDVISRPLLSQ